MISIEQLNRYCREDISKIENYNEAIKDPTQMWHCHHRAEILPCGRFSYKDLMKHGLYWHQPASRLILLPHSEHVRLHHKGMKHSEESKRRMSETLKGQRISEETRRKISEANKGHEVSSETRRKISEAHKRYWESRRAVS